MTDTSNGAVPKPSNLQPHSLPPAKKLDQPQQLFDLIGQPQQPQQFGQQSRFVSFGQNSGQERVQLTTGRTTPSLLQSGFQATAQPQQFQTFQATPQSSFSQAGLVGGTPQPNFQSFPTNNQNEIQIRPAGQPGLQQSQGFTIQDLGGFQGFDFDGSNSLTDNRQQQQPQQQQQFFQAETSPRRPSNARPPPNADPRHKDKVLSPSLSPSLSRPPASLSHLNAPASSDPVSNFAPEV